MTSKHVLAGRHRADRKRGLKRRLAAVAGGTAAAVVLGSATAYAYWSVTGSGSGSAAASSMSAPVVTAGTVTGASLYPGKTGATLFVNATNPNPFDITVTVAKPISGSITGCTSPDVTFSGGSFTVPANTTTAVERTIPNSVSMGNASSSDCQGQTLAIPLTTNSVSGASPSTPEGPRAMPRPAPAPRRPPLPWYRASSWEAPAWQRGVEHQRQWQRQRRRNQPGGS